jgi:acetylornithine deacetylase/succinyl-diaminopimelate desuccinylase-like protein
MEIIRELCSFEGRLAGTDAERRAANRLAERLREQGRKVAVEPTYVHPQLGLVYALHCAVGFAGSLVSVDVPALGFALVLLAATSMYLDMNARFYLLRRIFFRRASQNVIARGNDAYAPARLFITAHLDAARTGAAYSPARMRLLGRIANRLPFVFSPPRLLFWSLALLIPLVGVRMAGIDSDAISIAQLFPTLILLIGIFAFVDIELSDVVPGANDNASGVAAAISLADELAAKAPENLDVWVVLTGGEECLMQGMRSFVRSHRKRLADRPAYFLNLDSVGGGRVRYTASEGLAVSFDMGQRMNELCEAIAEAGASRNGDRPQPLASGFASDAVPIRLARFEATTITTLPEGAIVAANHHLAEDRPDAVDSESVDRAHEFALELARQLDRDVGRTHE